MNNQRRRTCLECEQVRLVDWQGVCEPCGAALNAGTLLQSPQVAEGGVIVRQLCIAGCEERVPAQLHLLEAET